eukprot:10650504-Ditylum_brightwellii.AAC.1
MAWNNIHLMQKVFMNGRDIALLFLTAENSKKVQADMRTVTLNAAAMKMTTLIIETWEKTRCKIQNACDQYGSVTISPSFIKNVAIPE